jgi:hypothetical protein
MTRAFQRSQSTASMSGSSENEHASLVFEGGATLTRLLSSRSVTATPRARPLETLKDGRSTAVLVNPEDPSSTLTRSSSSRTPILIFDPSLVPLPNTASSAATGGARTSGHSARTSGHSDVLSTSGQDGSWRKSIVSSEAAHSQDSSPKASPRTLVNLDDLEGYSDLFYRGAGSSIVRPKSGGSNKTTNSGQLMERSKRPDLVHFGSRNSAGPTIAEWSFFPEPRSSGLHYGSGTLSSPAQRQEDAEGAWRGSRASGHYAEANISQTWDPEDDG